MVFAYKLATSLITAVVRVLCSEDSDLEVNEGKVRDSGAASVANSSLAGACAGCKGEYVKESSLLAERARSSFSSNPLVGPKLHLSGVCLANASLNFLICN